MIRRAEIKDVPALTNIYNWYIENTTVTYETEKINEEEMTKRLCEISTNNPYLVYEEDGYVVGYAYAHQLGERAAFFVAAEVSIYMSKEVKGRGKGKELMKELQCALQQTKYATAVALIDSSNEISKKFFIDLGFVFAGELKNVGYKFGKWLGLTYYTKQLKEYS